MNESPQKIKPLLRMAIWEAHGRKCAYDCIPITWDQLEIDHIIPQSVWRDITKKRQVFENLGIDEDLLPDDPTNLIPCRSLRNGQKSDWVFNPGSVRFYRQLAEKKKTEVDRWLKKLKDQQEQDRIRSLAEAACDANPAIRKKLLEALSITEPYPIEDKIDKERLLLSRPRILLDCNLPKEDNLGSLLIRINTLYLHRVQLTLTADQILGSLLHGWGTTPDLKQRGFIIGTRTDYPDEWIVQIASATVFLTTEELEQLCEVVDLLAQHYLQTLLHRETANGTLAFAPDGPDNVILLTITRALWNAMLQFASEHDYEKGSSRWHVFDASGHGHIKTIHRTNDGEISSFQTHLYPKTPEEYGPLSEPLFEVDLCWNARMSRMAFPVDWNAQDTYRWLTKELIPEVISRLPREKETCLTKLKKMFLRIEPPEYFKENSGVDMVVFEEVQDWSSFTRVVELAQIHYNSHPNGPVCKSMVESALSVLGLLASELSVSPNRLGYIANKLNVYQKPTLSECVAAAQKTNKEQPSFDGYDLDMFLRCIWTLLKDNAPENGKKNELLAQISQTLKPLVDVFRYEVVRCRTLERIKTTSI